MNDDVFEEAETQNNINLAINNIDKTPTTGHQDSMEHQDLPPPPFPVPKPRRKKKTDARSTGKSNLMAYL